MSRAWKRETLVTRLEDARNALEDAQALLSAWDKVYGQDETGAETEERIKRMYFKERSITAVALWALDNIPGFERTKAGAAERVRDIIINQECGDDDLDRAALAIFSENRKKAEKYGN